MVGRVASRDGATRRAAASNARAVLHDDDDDDASDDQRRGKRCMSTTLVPFEPPVRARTRTMRSAALVAPRSFAVSAAEIPEPRAGEVRVRIEGSGVCASSLPVWEGREWFEYPRTS